MCTWSIQIFDDDLFIFLPGPFFLPLRDFCFLYMQWGKSHFLFYYCNNWLNKIDEKVLRKSVISRLLYSTSTFCIWLALDFSSSHPYWMTEKWHVTSRFSGEKRRRLKVRISAATVGNYTCFSRCRQFLIYQTTFIIDTNYRILSINLFLLTRVKKDIKYKIYFIANFFSGFNFKFKFMLAQQYKLK